MQRSDQINELAVALAKAQALIKQPAKTRTATIKSDKGSYGYKYADLPDIIDAYRQPFSDNGLSIVQSVSTDDRRVAITTVLLHGSGQWIQDTLFMPVADNRPQAIGSAITYGRRYAISAMVGVAPDEDDDGHEAQGAPPARKPQPAPRYDRPEEDVPFEGPPARIAAPAGPELFSATPRQMSELRRLAKLEGIESNAEIASMAMAFKGFDATGKKAWPAAEAEHLQAAVKQWASERAKA